MFDDLLKTLRALDGKTVSVDIPTVSDAEGYCDKQCPAEECEFLFKVHEDDWCNTVRDDAVWCPFCGHQEPATSWWTKAQVEKAQEVAFAEMKHSLNSAMRRDAKKFNRRQPRGSFVSMSMKVDARPKEVVLPAAATGPMQLKIECAECSCRYAVIGSAYFCPSCGHNAADRVFGQSLGTIRSTLENLPAISSGLTDPDIAGNTTRLLIEDSLQRLVTAFQRYAEALYEKKSTEGKARRNAFQNLDDGSRIWLAAFGSGYDAYVSSAELARIKRGFQQRHLLAHCEGIVDEDYLARTGDQNYQVGQRLVIKEALVGEYLVLVEKLGEGLALSVAQP